MHGDDFMARRRASFPDDAARAADTPIPRAERTFRHRAIDDGRRTTTSGPRGARRKKKMQVRQPFDAHDDFAADENARADRLRSRPRDGELMLHRE